MKRPERPQIRLLASPSCLLSWPFTRKLYCSLPNPRNVHFESINMKNVLHWSAPDGTGDGVVYKVKYSVYGVGKWIRKSECRNISRTWCDLSSETADYEEQYYASVKAFLHGVCSDWTETARFNPLTETKIDPPMVSISSTEKSISIILTAPEKWKGSPEEESISLAQVYPGLQYNVSVLNKKTKKRWWFSVSNTTLVVPWLEPGTVYCVSAQIHVTTPLLHSAFSKEYCIATLKDKTADQIITNLFGYVLPITLAVLFISMACYYVHRYIHVSKQKHPTNLVWHYTDKCKDSVFIPCEKIVVNLITINVDEYKASQESIHLSEGKGPRYYTIYSDTVQKDLSPKVMQETIELLNISHEVDIFSKEHQTRNWSLYGQAGPKNTMGQKNEGNIEYGLDVRAEDFTPGQKLMELCLKEKSSAPRELQGESHLVESLANSEVGQPYCPQLEMMTADPCLEQNLEELDLKMVPENEQTILVDWDPHTGRLYIPTLSSIENEACEAVFHCDAPDKEGILSRLYKKQISDETSEDQEMCLLRFREQWELHVKMED
uniref:Interleukin 20 receptor subunit alpha n=1 Tax=Nothoprocta perdicaria TaxID=30464 RepID=A0A8C7ECG8_NOTPE